MTLGKGSIGGFVARLVAGAVLLLMAAAAPSGAFAHSGHAHAAKPLPVVAAQSVAQAKPQAIAAAATHMHDAVADAFQRSSSEDRTNRFCGESCCSSGLSCCMALEPCRPPFVGLSPDAGRLLPDEWRRLASLSPPGLIRPPARLV